MADIFWDSQDMNNLLLKQYSQYHEMIFQDQNHEFQLLFHHVQDQPEAKPKILLLHIRS